jgi:hypothetical protein
MLDQLRTGFLEDGHLSERAQTRTLFPFTQRTMSGWLGNYGAYVDKAWDSGKRMYDAYLKPPPPSTADVVKEKVSGIANAGIEGLQEAGKRLQEVKETVETAAQLGNNVIQVGNEFIQDVNQAWEGPQAQKLKNSFGALRSGVSHRVWGKPAEPVDRTIIALGKSGYGISQLLNLLCEQAGFATRDPTSFSSCTKEPQAQTNSIRLADDKLLRLQAIDAVGVFDPQWRETIKDVLRFVTNRRWTRENQVAFASFESIRRLQTFVHSVQPDGLHGALIVLRGDVVFTKEEKLAVKLIMKLIPSAGSSLWQRMAVVVTHCEGMNREQLEAMKTNMAENSILEQLFDSVGQRVFFVGYNSARDDNATHAIRHENLKQLQQFIYGLPNERVTELSNNRARDRIIHAQTVFVPSVEEPPVVRVPPPRPAPTATSIPEGFAPAVALNIPTPLSSHPVEPFNGLEDHEVERSCPLL